ncbi:MAG TPA: arginine N-succinyltransferase [Planctomycetaceae bacterium]|nr:arginine N-succinyltransferase [Planctomycetaceae bacterium]
MLVRSVTLEDFDQLWGLVEKATYGMTTLQISREQLRERIEQSDFAFRRSTEKATGDPYVFVMVDSESGKLVGLSCIFSKTGGYEPFYSYRRITQTHYSGLLEKSVEVETLHLAKIHDGPTEIGSLFLLPDFRGNGRGRLLSLARFAFIAAHPLRFDSEVIAEMRGVMDDDGRCPFWEAIGRHFFGIDFPQADSLSTMNKCFIEQLMPHYPIYSCLLSPETRDIMGKVHPATEPALKMLKAEGFEVIDLIDIFDGGPVVQCARDSIHAVRRCVEKQIGQIEESAPESKENPQSLLATVHEGFAATLASVEAIDEINIAIPAATAKLLDVQVGDSVWQMALYPAR